MQLSDNGLKLIQSFEGLDLNPYLDTAGVPTIGYGTIMYPSLHPVTMQDPPITLQKALQYLEWEVNQKVGTVVHLIQVDCTQNQFDALVSFAYNEGLGALKTSTLLRLFNSGDVQGAADQFLVWDKNRVNGVLVFNQGLLNRRQAERKLFLTPDAPVV
jgi:lysozyme